MGQGGVRSGGLGMQRTPPIGRWAACATPLPPSPTQPGGQRCPCKRSKRSSCFACALPLPLSMSLWRSTANTRPAMAGLAEAGGAAGRPEE
eukprot:12174195-Alexandrium_andersonii.AAC.1